MAVSPQATLSTTDIDALSATTLDSLSTSEVGALSPAPIEALPSAPMPAPLPPMAIPVDVMDGFKAFARELVEAFKGHNHLSSDFHVHLRKHFESVGLMEPEPPADGE